MEILVLHSVGLKFEFPSAADRLDVYDDIMGFFWTCAKAFPILNLMPGFLMPLVIPMNQSIAACHQADKWI